MNKRSQWNSILTFILAMIGLTIGIGNIWRFSYVLYSNGGGSFFIPYVIAILIMGIPFWMAAVVCKDHPMQPGSLLLERFVFVLGAIIMCCLGAHYEFAMLDNLSVQKNLFLLHLL